MHHLKHFIFDFSGTIFDDHQASFLVTQEVIQHFSGHSISWEDYKNDFSIPVHNFYYKYIGEHIVVSEIDAYYFAIFDKYLHQGQVFQGVRESFAEIVAQGKTISVFSTVKQNILEEMMQSLGLVEFVSEIHGSVFDKVQEFQNHQSLKKFAAQDVLYVGDMDHDVLAAKQNGMVSGAVLCGYHSVEKILKAQPRLVWQSPEQWPDFFRSLSAKRPFKVAKPHVVATVGALVFNSQGECLLILTDKWQYTYGIPGGKIDFGEEALAAVKRELKEETSLDVLDAQLFLMQDCIDSTEFYVQHSKFLLMNYIARTESTDVVLNDEAQGYLWMQPELALLLPLNEPTRVLIEKYLAKIQFQKTAEEIIQDRQELEEAYRKLASKTS